MNYKEMKRSDLEKALSNANETASRLADQFGSPDYMDEDSKQLYYDSLNDSHELEKELYNRDENSKSYAKQYGDKKKRDFKEYLNVLENGQFKNPQNFISHIELRKVPSEYRGKWFNTIIDLKVNDDQTIIKPMVQYLSGMAKNHLLDNSKRKTSVIFEKSLPKDKKFLFRDSSNKRFLIDYENFNNSKMGPFTDRP